MADFGDFDSELTAASIVEILIATVRLTPSSNTFIACSSQNVRKDVCFGSSES